MTARRSTSLHAAQQHRNEGKKPKGRRGFSVTPVLFCPFSLFARDVLVSDNNDHSVSSNKSAGRGS